MFNQYKKTHNNLLMNKLSLKKEINISYKKTNLANGGIYLINKRILNKIKISLCHLKMIYLKMK